MKKIADYINKHIWIQCVLCIAVGLWFGSMFAEAL